MSLLLQQSEILAEQSEIKITGSKSESNRLLVLKSLLGNLELLNLSNSDDTQVMQKALTSNSETIDIHHAGTAMRFLTAYFAVQEGREVVLTGSSRMKERPISVLVDALRNLGVEIKYVSNEGYPPIKIKGREIGKSEVSLQANVSSQYISALLLIGGFLPNGLQLNLLGKVTSVPYIEMTLNLLGKVGIQSTFKDNRIVVDSIRNQQSSSKNQQFVVESDWSSASYFYSLIALSEIGTRIQLSAYKKDSLQGDACLSKIYKQFGVETIFEDNSIILQKSKISGQGSIINLDLSNSPDIAQTIAVTCFGLGMACDLTGLHTLKIKETDRLEALKTELSKFGANIEVTNQSLHLKERADRINSGVSVATYQDHRMAMAFAPLALKTTLKIEESEVVSKSYPDFWKDLKRTGIKISEI